MARFKGIPVEDPPAPVQPRFGGGIPVDVEPPAARLAAPSEPVPVYDPMGSFTGYSETALPPPSPQDDAAPRAFWRGIGQGLTFGFGDEMTGAASGAAGWLRGQGYGPAYDASVTESRRRNEEAKRNHPWAYGAGQVTGGVGGVIPMAIAAPTAMGVAGGMSLGARVAAGLGSGAALGGLQGAGEATGGVGDRLAPAGQGALIGAAFGAGLPLVGAGAGKLASGATQYLAERGIQVPGLGRRAANTLADTVNASPPGAIRDRLTELGPDAFLADASPALGALTQGLATRPEGTARNRIVEALLGRDRGTNARVAQSLDQNLGPASVPSQIEAQFAARRAEAGRMYGAALADAPPIDTRDALTMIGQRLTTAEGAERTALLRARDLLMPQRGPGGSRIIQTDPRNLHSAKQELDRLIQYGDPQMGIPRGVFSTPDSALFGVRRSLNDALEAQVPRYAEANLMAQTAHGASEALESGQQALRPTVHPADFAAAFENAPIERQAAARLGMRADIDRTAGNQINDLQAVRQVIKGEGDWNRAKLAQAFGPEAAERTAADIEREIAFRNTYQKAIEGSQTANRTLGARAVDVREPSFSGSMTDIGVGGMAGGPAGAAGAAAVRGGRYGLGAVGRRSDIDRNNQIAEALIASGGGRDAVLDALLRRAEARGADRTAIAAGTDRIVRLLLGATERNSDNRQRLDRYLTSR